MQLVFVKLCNYFDLLTNHTIRNVAQLNNKFINKTWDEFLSSLSKKRIEYDCCWVIHFITPLIIHFDTILKSIPCRAFSKTYQNQFKTNTNGNHRTYVNRLKIDEIDKIEKHAPQNVYYSEYFRCSESSATVCNHRFNKKKKKMMEI